MEEKEVGKKFDDGKLRWELLPLEPIEDVIKILMLGANKYGDENWKLVVKENKMRYYNAMMRHISAWKKGEAADKESNLNPLAHAACCLIFLMWNDKRLNKEENKE